MPAGEYEVTLTAEDHADHVVSDTIAIHVGVPAEQAHDSDTPTSSDTAPDGGSSGASAEGSSGGASDASGEGSDTAGQDNGGCRISGSGGGPLGLLAPLLGLGLGLRARRRP